MEEVPSSTEIVTSENPTQLSRPAIERRLVGHRPRVKWPAAADKKQWEAIDSDLSLTLEQLKGTVEKKLESMGDIIHQYEAERFGIQERKGQKMSLIAPTFRRQKEIKHLIQQMRQLRKQWKKALEGEKEGIEVLQADIKYRLASLNRAENLRRRRRKKERSRTQFYKDPFKFLKSLFTREKSGSLKAARKDLEDHLKATHPDPRRHERMTIPPDIPPINSPEHQMESGPPT